MKAAVVSVLLAITSSCLALASAPCDSQGRVSELLEEGDAFRAVSLLKEREYSLRGTPHGLGCARRLLGVFLDHEEWEWAERTLSRIERSYAAFLPGTSFARVRAELLFLHGSWTAASQALSAVPSKPEDSHAELHTLSLAAQDPWNPPPCQGSPQFCQGYSQYQNERAQTPRLNPALAGWLGVIPGLGQAYSGRWLAGLGSFLVNAALITASALGYANQEWAFAGLTSFVGFGVYAGSIYAGIEAARRENEVREQRLRKRLLEAPVELQLLKIRLPAQ